MTSLAEASCRETVMRKVHRYGSACMHSARRLTRERQSGGEAMSEDEEDEEEGSEYADDNESFADVDDLEGKPYHSISQP